MEIKRVHRRESLVFEKIDETFLLKDDIIMNNISLYEDEFSKRDHIWRRLVKEDIDLQKKRINWISYIKKITDEFEFSYDSCEIAIQYMDIFIEKKIENKKNTEIYESDFMRRPIEEWMDKPDEFALFLGVIISLSGKYQELQKDSNIMIRGVEKKKMGKGEYEMMDYLEYLVPYKTPSFFMYLFMDDFLDPEKIIFYTYRMTKELFQYSYYIYEKHTLLSLSILKYIIIDIFKQSFLMPLWQQKVQKYIKNKEERDKIDEIYEKIGISLLKTDGFIEGLHQDYIKRDIHLKIQNKVPLSIPKDVELEEDHRNPTKEYRYFTPKKVRFRIGKDCVDIGYWELPIPPVKKVKVSE
jgi:hypothetical protein